ncbi:thiamine-phosphate kinase [Thermococcus sp. Bubb.Bath]|uniref:thiamine-phosphate kinase n=1 Tax=Thermococcus sp. Bubb.Bath TaxID=1638242 RepID=UPI00143B5EB6|nr:thiamine-phosphate kinase [Thermococcus sp. Bubb.Bath]NJF25438.1 thiamine-phosphate kinase [Thermococcus sp. Bubb.Bath]
MRESEIITLFLKHLKKQGDLPLGDDAGALRMGHEWLVATNDMLVRKTDVPDIMTPEQVGFKAVTMNVSDVAAMGAKPVGFLFSLGIPAGLGADYLEGIARGIENALEFYDVPVLSADTNEADDLIIDGIALGITGKPLTRSGAKPGDLVCVTGDLGRALAGYLVWRHNLEVPKDIRNSLYEKFLSPKARVSEGILLGGIANAAIDVSDGLSKELYLLAGMSGVRIRISSARLPIREEVVKVAETLSLDPVEVALSSGEEFELLFTVTSENVLGLDFDFTVIGRAEKGAGVYIDGTPLPRGGWEHLVTHSFI